MARVLAIDYGKKRVGLAVTDPMQMIANPLATVPANEIMDFLTRYFQQEEVEMVLVGYPVQMNNEPSEAIRFINPFIQQLEKKFPSLKIQLADERFTSKMAFQAMIDGGLKKKQRQDKAIIDTISATIILQSYLDSKANNFKV